MNSSPRQEQVQRRGVDAATELQQLRGQAVEQAAQLERLAKGLEAEMKKGPRGGGGGVEGRWKSMENGWTSMENQWKSMEIDEFPCLSMAFGTETGRFKRRVSMRPQASRLTRRPGPSTGVPAVSKGLELISGRCSVVFSVFFFLRSLAIFWRFQPVFNRFFSFFFEGF